MKTNYKKIVKLATLLLTSILIAKASADAYTYLFMKVGITITSQEVFWIRQGQIIDGSTVTLSFTVQDGVYTWHNNTLYLKNIGSDIQIGLKVTKAISGQLFDICKVHVYENSTEPGVWKPVGILNALNLNDGLEDKTLKGNGYFKFNFEIQAKPNVTGNSDFEITVLH